MLVRAACQGDVQQRLNRCENPDGPAIRELASGSCYTYQGSNADESQNCADTLRSAGSRMGSRAHCQRSDGSNSTSKGTDRASMRSWRSRGHAASLGQTQE